MTVYNEVFLALGAAYMWN